MLGGKKLLAVACLVAGLVLPAQAMAFYEAWTRADLNLRVGPGTGYGVIDVIPYGEPVAVLGCLDGIEWCDVEWYGLRGWVAAYYLVQPGTSLYLERVYPRIGLPIITFSFFDYHDRHYRDRPWYHKRQGLWRGRDWRDERRHRVRKDGKRYEDPNVGEAPKKGKRKQRPVQRQQIEVERQRQEIEPPREPQETKKSRQRSKQRLEPQVIEGIEGPRQLEETNKKSGEQRDEDKKSKKRRKPETETETEAESGQ